MNKQRTYIYSRRQHALKGERIGIDIANMLVHAAGFMAFGAYDRKTSGSFHVFRQLDVGAAASHIGGYGHSARASSLCHDVGFLLVQFRVEDIVGYLAHGELAAQI